MNSNPDHSRSSNDNHGIIYIIYNLKFQYLAFVSLDINDELSVESSIMISESFSKSFESLKHQMARMTGDLNTLQDETKKLGTKFDSHSLRENMYKFILKLCLLMFICRNRKLINMSKEIDSTGNELKLLSQQTFSVKIILMINIYLIHMCVEWRTQ